MVELQDGLKRMEDADIQLIGISYDDIPVLKSFSDANQISFPLLSDHQSKTGNQTIHNYQVFDPRESGKYRGVPVPTTIVVNSDKEIHAILSGTIKNRPSIDELIQATSKPEK